MRAQIRPAIGLFLSAAQAAIRDALDLTAGPAPGALAQSATLDPHIGLSVTTTASVAGFGAGLVIGEAPAAPQCAVT